MQGLKKVLSCPVIQDKYIIVLGKDMDKLLVN